MYELFFHYMKCLRETGDGTFFIFLKEEKDKKFASFIFSVRLPTTALAMPTSLTPMPSGRLAPTPRRLTSSCRASTKTTPRCNSLSTRSTSSSASEGASSSSPPSFADVASALADVARRATAAVLTPRPAGFPPGPAEDVAPAFLTDPLGTLEALEARYGGVVGVVLGGERVVVVGGGGRAGALAAADVLLDPRQSFAKAGTAFFPGSDVTGNGLLTSDGDSWKRQRALATPAFRKAAVEAYGAAMAKEAEEAAARDWRTPSPASSPAKTRDLYSDFNSLTLRIVTTALFGSRLDDGEGSRVAAAVDAAFARFAAAGVLGGSGSGSNGSQLILELLPEWFPGGGGGGSSNGGFKRAVADLDEVVYEIIASRRRRLGGKGNREGKKAEGEDAEDDDGEKVSVGFLFPFSLPLTQKQMTTSDSQ